ncbi:MAG: hypothetical protein J5I93_02610, partial [Pirellulaceae bacterium]|nr:hypothetical protein [Pirellulaceae bacterium]
MSHAVPAPATRRSTWIISPFWDLAFLVGTPVVIVPLMAFLTRRWFTPEQISLVVVSFASLGHHLPGFMRAYGDRDLFWRFHWRFLLVPPLVLATALLFAWRDLHGLSLLLLGWSTWHGLMQTYGFMRIYDLKRGRADRWSAELDFALCLAIFVAGVVFSDARVFGISEAMWLAGIPPLGAVWLSAARWLVGGATCVVIGLYVGHLVWNGRGGRGVTWNKVLLAGTTGWLYWVSGMISTNILIGVAMFEVFHAVQYYAIVWVYNRKLADRVGPRFGPLGFLFQHRWTFLLLYLAAIVAFGCIRYLGAEVQQPGFQKLLLAVLTTSTLLHFYYDGFIWKVREAETAANLDIDTSLARWTRLRVPAVRHVGKWALFYGLLGLLFWLESGSQATAARDAERLAALAAWTPELPEPKLRLSAAALERGDSGQA